jgi:hypothetical protein
LSHHDPEKPLDDLDRVAVGHIHRLSGDGSFCLSPDRRFSIVALSRLCLYKDFSVKADK